MELQPYRGPLAPSAANITCSMALFYINDTRHEVRAGGSPDDLASSLNDYLRLRTRFKVSQAESFASSCHNKRNKNPDQRPGICMRLVPAVSVTAGDQTSLW